MTSPGWQQSLRQYKGWNLKEWVEQGDWDALRDALLYTKKTILSPNKNEIYDFLNALTSLPSLKKENLPEDFDHILANTLHRLDFNPFMENRSIENLRAQNVSLSKAFKIGRVPELNEEPEMRFIEWAIEQRCWVFLEVMNQKINKDYDLSKRWIHFSNQRGLLAQIAFHWSMEQSKLDPPPEAFSQKDDNKHVPFISDAASSFREEQAMKAALKLAQAQKVFESVLKIGAHTFDANLHARDIRGYSPLHAACGTTDFNQKYPASLGHPGVLKTIHLLTSKWLSLNEIVEPSRYKQLFTDTDALVHGNPVARKNKQEIEIVSDVLEKKEGLLDFGTLLSPVHLAARSSSLGVLQYLLEQEEVKKDVLTRQKNMTFWQGETIVHYWCEGIKTNRISVSDFKKGLEIMASHGVDLEACGKASFSPRDLLSGNTGQARSSAFLYPPVTGEPEFALKMGAWVPIPEMLKAFDLVLNQVKAEKDLEVKRHEKEAKERQESLELNPALNQMRERVKEMQAETQTDEQGRSFLQTESGAKIFIPGLYLPEASGSSTAPNQVLEPKRLGRPTSEPISLDQMEHAALQKEFMPAMSEVDADPLSEMKLESSGTSDDHKNNVRRRLLS